MNKYNGYIHGQMFGPIYAKNERDARRQLREGLGYARLPDGSGVQKVDPDAERRLHRLLTSPEQMEHFRDL